MVQNNNPFSNIIGVAGQIGSGKSTLVKELSIQLCAKKISFGNFVREAAEKRSITTDRQSLQALGESLINELGYKEFTKRVLQSSQLESDQLAIVDGIRHIEVWLALSSLVLNSTLIYLDIPEIVRIKRVERRDKLNGETIFRNMSHPMEKNIPLLKPYADIVLEEMSTDMMIGQIVEKLR